MHLRNKLLIIAVTFGVLAIALAVLGDADALFMMDASATPTVGRNVVLITVDDMRLDELVYMPKTLALLAASGVTFDQSYAATPLCCPARATMLTGQYSHNHGVLTNKPELGQGYLALDHSNTLAVWLQAAGYDTIFLGKYLNGYGKYGFNPAVADKREVPPGWTDWQGLVGPLKYRYFELNVNGKIVTYPISKHAYQTDELAKRASASIDREADAGRNFYLWLAPLAPHEESGNPPVPKAAYEHSYDGVPLPAVPSMNEADVTDKPWYVRNTPLLSAERLEELRAHREARLETLQSADDMVETVYRKLEARGLLSSTLIVFNSDNGYLLGEHRLEGKVKVYEESTHVPLIMLGGPFAGGQHVSVPVSNIDIAPTMVAWLGQPPTGRTFDGIDLAPVVADPQAYADRALLLESVEGPAFAAIRTGQWVYTEYAGSKELYDLGTDPYQLRSLANVPAHADLRRRLREALGSLRHCAGATCQVTVPAVS